MLQLEADAERQQDPSQDLSLHMAVMEPSEGVTFPQNVTQSTQIIDAGGLIPPLDSYIHERLL